MFKTVENCYRDGRQKNCLQSGLKAPSQLCLVVKVLSRQQYDLIVAAVIKL